MWPAGIRGTGRVVDDYVSFIDFAPTFLELAGVKLEQTGMQPITGRSLTEIFRAEGNGRVIAARDHVLIGKERHDVGRPDDVGYPIRGIVKDDLIYLINFEPSRWPCGNPEVGYPNVDGGPTKTEVLKTRKIPEMGKLWELSFGRRPAEEFYDARKDPECMENLAGRAEFEAPRAVMRKQLLEELTAQQDPRMFGHGDVFDKYPYADEKFRDYYNRYMKGEKLKANWISESDIEKDPPK
jgi:arylsulfatase A-like enzyme